MSSGDYNIDDSVYILFTTRAFATGIPGTLSAATVAVYSNVTATPVQTAVAVTESLNAIAGLNAVTLACTTANGYAAGESYHVVLESGSVDSVSVAGEVVGSFTLVRAAVLVPVTGYGSAIQTRVNFMPAITAGQAGGLFLAGTNAATTVNFTGSVTSVTNTVNANVTEWKGATAAAVDTAGYPVVTIKDGTGQGEILTAAGAINAVGLVSGDIGGLSANAVSDVAAAVWNAATVTYGAAGSYGLLVETNLDVVLSERTLLAASYFDAITDTVDVGSWLGTAVTKSINNVPDINVKEINDVPITGDGTGGDPFDVV